MPIYVVVASSNKAVLDAVTSRRASLLPDGIRANGFSSTGGEEVALSAFDAEGDATDEKLLNHILSLNLEKATGVLILSDSVFPQNDSALRDIFCVSQFHSPSYGQKVANIMSSVITRSFRSYRHYINRFRDRKYESIIRLPLRNFIAPELERMRLICRDMTAQENFGREFDKLLGEIRNRQQPKKASSNPETYFVDDEEKHFSLGPEKHAQADTSIPPHTHICVLANRFRFGRVFDGRYHYNVSRDQDRRMTGDYHDCHSTLRSGGGGKHLNMFSSDFF